MINFKFWSKGDIMKAAMLLRDYQMPDPVLSGFYVCFLWLYVSIFSVFTFILRTTWWGGTVLTYRNIAKDAKAIGRVSIAYSHHPQVVAELEFGWQQSVWSEEPSSAGFVTPSWLTVAENLWQQPPAPRE